MIGLGDTSSWLGIVSSPKEVYLFRVRAHGLAPKSPLDLLAFVRAVGQSRLSPDVRAVTLWSDSGEPTIDVIVTSPGGTGVTFLVPSSDGVLEDVAKNVAVQRIFPGIVLHDPELLQLTAPQDAIDFWLVQPLLWDRNLPGPTDVFANPFEYSVDLGKADDGPRVKPWKEGQPMPSLPGSGGNALFLVLGAGLAAYIIYRVTRKR